MTTEYTHNNSEDNKIQFHFMGKVAAIDQSDACALVLDLQSMAAFSLPAQRMSAQQWQQLRVGQHLRFTEDGYGEIKDLEFVPQGVHTNVPSTI